MLDKERVLVKFDELDSYLSELRQIIPQDYEDYVDSIEKKRSCERLLHIAIESVIDICSLIVSNLKLGIPSDEKDVFEKLKKRKIISHKLYEQLKRMKGFRNILFHRYNYIDDELVFKVLQTKLKDFDEFKREILKKTGLKH